MTVGVQKIGIVPAVIVAFEFEEPGAASVGAGQAQGEHSGFAAAVGESNDLGGWDHAPQALRRFHFGRGRGGEVRACAMVCETTSTSLG